MTLTEIKDRLERGRRFVANWRVLYGIDRLTGHGIVSPVVKATVCHLGGRTLYHPRWWQRYI